MMKLRRLWVNEPVIQKTKKPKKCSLPLSLHARGDDSFVLSLLLLLHHAVTPLFADDVPPPYVPTKTNIKSNAHSKQNKRQQQQQEQRIPFAPAPSAPSPGPPPSKCSVSHKK